MGVPWACPPFTPQQETAFSVGRFHLAVPGRIFYEISSHHQTRARKAGACLVVAGDRPYVATVEPMSRVCYELLIQ
ncbi:MAG: hypothetical protein ACXWPS_19070 [Ktedonobacteraceae bacterium]